MFVILSTIQENIIKMDNPVASTMNLSKCYLASTKILLSKTPFANDLA